MIRVIFSILLLSFLSSCDNITDYFSDYDDRPDTTHTKADSQVAWYAGKDTADAGEVIACGSGYFYKKLDSNSVLLVQYSNPIFNDTTIELSLNSGNSDQYTQLYLFRNHNATLRNFCTDVVRGDAEPDTTLTNSYGNIVIKFKQPAKGDRSGKTAVSIYIKQLTFLDVAENKTFIVKNRVYWKITDWQWFPG